jgi:hypothetical protein
MNTRRLARLAAACGMLSALVGCVYDPYGPGYAAAYATAPVYAPYSPPPAYYYPAPAYPAYGSVNLGFGFGGGGWHDRGDWHERGDWRERGWRHGR